jgi:hypothetical protein
MHHASSLSIIRGRGATLESRHREWWNSVMTDVLLMFSGVRASGKS